MNTSPPEGESAAPSGGGLTNILYENHPKKYPKISNIFSYPPQQSFVSDLSQTQYRNFHRPK